MTEQVKHPLPSPLLIPTLCWVTGIALASAFQIPFIWLAGFSAVTIILALIFRFRLPFLAVLLILAGFIRFNLSIQKPESFLAKALEQRESISQTCAGEVLRVLNDRHDFYLVRLSAFRGIPVKDVALMFYPHQLVPGDRFQAHALLISQKPDPVLDSQNFSNRLPLSLRGDIGGEVPVVSPMSPRSNYGTTKIILKTVYELKPLPATNKLNLERIRYRLLQSLDRKMGSAAPFAKALLLNDRTEDRDWVQQLIQGGLLHVIAISGLHVVFFYFIFVHLFNIFLPKRWAEAVFIVLMLAYAGLCQWSPPVMRAILMILLYLLAKWLQRPVSPMQITCLSLLIITAVAPMQLFSVGLQLSYLCVITILYVVPKVKTAKIVHPLWKHNLRKVRLYLLDMVIVSVVVSLVMLPILLFYFYRGSLNGIVGNLVGIPLAAALLPLSFILLVLPSNWGLFVWLKAVFDLLHIGFEKWVEITANLPFYIDRVAVPLSLLIAAYLVIAAIAIRIKKGLEKKNLTYVLLIIALVLTVYSFIPQKQQFCLTVFNAGLGDCILVRYPDGQTLMVDTGPQTFNRNGNTDESWFGNHTNLWQKKQRISTIDILVLSHLDFDHAGGLKDVLRKMRVRNVFVSRHSAESDEWHELLRTDVFKGTQVKVISDTVSFDFAGGRLAFLHPGKDYIGADNNDYSLVLRLDYKDFSALLPGDISSEVERMLVEEIPQRLDADFLKVPHHGSSKSSSMPFIRAVSPKQACVTAPLKNRFRFPHKATLKRYREYGVEPQVTGNGSVVIAFP